MKCIHINKSSVIFILLSTFFNNIQFTHLADNNMDMQNKNDNQKNHTSTDIALPSLSGDSILPYPNDIKCSELDASYLNCDYNNNCIYGSLVNITCHSIPGVECKEQKSLQKTYICRYCYQTEPWEHDCDLKANCNSASTPRAYYRSNCTVKSNVLCLGNRKFFKNVRCNWTVGYSWSTALILSITLGGFGADRFYLGHWQEGIGKLFSFGGLGVWTLVDVILISLHYLGPADGSLYI